MAANRGFYGETLRKFGKGPNAIDKVAGSCPNSRFNDEQAAWHLALVGSPDFRRDQRIKIRAAVKERWFGLFEQSGTAL
jgi:hypothetical protein